MHIRKPARAIRQYATIGLQTGVESATPHRLVEMLVDGALAKIAAAQNHMQLGETAGKGQRISSAISIIEGLRGSLDLQNGGILAGNLERLYDYMARRLLEANLENDPLRLTEVHSLLSELRAGWAGIGPQIVQSAAENTGVPMARTSA